MSYSIFPTLGALEFELRQHPQRPLALLDLEDYLVLVPENDEAERLLDAMEEHDHLPRTYSWISSDNRKERLYRRPQGLVSRRLVIGDARLVFRTGSGSYPVAASPAKAEDYANTGDPAMLIAKPASFPKKALQLIETMAPLLAAMHSRD
jgi:hypothetical protein